MEKLSEFEKDYVEEARRIANRLIEGEYRGPGDTVGAMQRLDAKYGIPFSFLKSLRYGNPKDIYMGPWLRLRAAYEAEVARQRRLWEAEEARNKVLRDAVVSPLARASSALAGANDDAPESPSP